MGAPDDDALLRLIASAYDQARDAHLAWLRSLIATGLSAQTRLLDEERVRTEAHRQELFREASNAIIVRYRDQEPS